MSKRKWPTVLLASLLLIALTAGIFYFAGLTVPASFPYMSSYNSGPQGAKLFFDALSGTKPLDIKRNYLSLSRWHPTSTTILFLAVPAAQLDGAEKDDLVQFEKLTQPNNRLVLCIEDDSFIPKPDPKQPLQIIHRWGIQIIDQRKKDDADAALFLKRDSSWQPVDGQQDVVEKKFGAHGTIVIALHSDDLSNKSLASDSAIVDEIPALLGPNTTIAFDETHLGIRESGSIAGLIRSFRLQGLIAGLLVIVGLFIWNQSVSFPPPPKFERRDDKPLVGADSRGVFASLIARHLTPQSLMESCIAEWNRLKPQQRITGSVPSMADPAAAYRQLQENLQQKRRI